MATLWVLMDNTVSEHYSGAESLAGSHGLSMALLPEGGEPVLWDTGPDETFLRNWAAMAAADPELPSVKDVGMIALSHGHHDHSGGLPALRRAGCTAPLCAHPDALRSRFRRTPEGNAREIGWRGGEESANLRAVADVLPLAPKVEMHTRIPREPGRYQAVDNFFLDREFTRPDTVADDAALVVHGKHGDSLILGCCHSGLRNTLQAVWLRSGVEQVHTVAGGLHLAQAPEAAVEETAQALKDYGVKRVFAGHCTGERGLELLRQRLPDVVRPLGAGLRIEL